ncbi:hypothetical protein ACHAWC_009003 [Mediolabrus comicus]
MTKSQRLHQLYDPPSSSSVAAAAAASESEETSNNNNNNEGPQPGAYAVSPGSGSPMQSRSDEVVQQQQQQSVSVEEAEAAMAAAIEHAEQGFPGAVFYVPGDPLLRPRTSSQQNNNNTVRRGSGTTFNTATTEDNTAENSGGSSGSSSNLMATDDHPDNNDNNNNMMTAHVQHLEAVALDPEEADAPSAIGIQLRNLNGSNNNNRRRSSDLATAVISNAKVVVSGDSYDEPIAIDESHPRVAYQELVDIYNRSVWTKFIVKWTVGGLIVALIGLGLGLGLPRNSSSGAGGSDSSVDRPLRNNWTLEGYSLQSEGYALGSTEDSQLGASSMLTVGGSSVLSGSPGWNGGVGTAGLFPLSSSPSSSKDSSATNTSTTSNTTNDTSPSSSAAAAAAATNTSATEAKLLIPKFESIFSGSPLPSTDHCGESISTDSYGRTFAIGCPSTSGRGYVKVFMWDFSSPPQQMGQTLYGKHVNDGFGSSVSVSGAARKATDRPDSKDGGNRLAIGSKGGYAELWILSRVYDEYMDEWVRLDEGGVLDHPDYNYSEDKNIDHDDGEVIVTLSGQGLALYVGFPSYDNNRGIVKSFSLAGGSPVQRIDPPRHNSLEGLEEGDRFGSDIATDVQGGFAVIGTRGGGYVRAVEFVDVPAPGQFRPVGGSKIPYVYAAPPGQESLADGVNEGEEVMTEISEDGNYGLLTVDTGRVPYRGCPTCGFEVDNRRIIVGSSKGFVVYQFVGDELLWYHIASVTSQEGDGIESGNIVDVSMSPDCRYVGIGTPSAEGGRGRLDVYRILDHADEED